MRDSGSVGCRPAGSASGVSRRESTGGGRPAESTGGAISGASRRRQPAGVDRRGQPAGPAGGVGRHPVGPLVACRANRTRLRRQGPLCSICSAIPGKSDTPAPLRPALFVLLRYPGQIGHAASRPPERARLTPPPGTRRLPTARACSINPAARNTPPPDGRSVLDSPRYPGQTEHAASQHRDYARFTPLSGANTTRGAPRAGACSIRAAIRGQNGHATPRSLGPVDLARLRGQPDGPAGTSARPGAPAPAPRRPRPEARAPAGRRVQLAPRRGALRAGER
jgi:hypothetical protein